jgi:hypothetical protein
MRNGHNKAREDALRYASNMKAEHDSRLKAGLPGLKCILDIERRIAALPKKHVHWDAPAPPVDTDTKRMLRMQQMHEWYRNSKNSRVTTRKINEEPEKKSIPQIREEWAAVCRKNREVRG